MQPFALHENHKSDEPVGGGFLCVRLGWLIDPLNRTVHVYKPGVPSVILRDVQNVINDEILPGFVLNLRDIWSDSI